MNDTDKYLIMGIGLLFALLGIYMFFRKTAEGTNKIKLLKLEIELSAPSLVIFVIGALLVVFPFFINTDIQQANADVSDPEQKQQPSDKPPASDVRIPRAIDAAMDYSEQDPPRIFLIAKDQYWRYDIQSKRLDKGYPKPLKSWIKFKFIDAVVNVNKDKSFIFSGNKVMEYDNKKNKQIGKIKAIKSVLPDFPFDSIDAAFNMRNGKIYFFKGDKYARFDIANRTFDQPVQKINNTTWRGLAFGELNAVTPISGNEALMFYSDKVVRYNMANDKALSQPISLNDYFL